MKFANFKPYKIVARLQDQETIDYVFNYFSRFMTEKEAAALRHHTTLFNFRKSLSDDNTGGKASIFYKKGWLSEDEEVLSLLKDGFDVFKANTVGTIMKDHVDGIFFNNCPQCGRLARTPMAKQCRFCGNSWRS